MFFFFLRQNEMNTLYKQTKKQIIIKTQLYLTLLHIFIYTPYLIIWIKKTALMN